MKGSIYLFLCLLSFLFLFVLSMLHICNIIFLCCRFLERVKVMLFFCLMFPGKKDVFMQICKEKSKRDLVFTPVPIVVPWGSRAKTQLYIIMFQFFNVIAFMLYAFFLFNLPFANCSPVVHLPQFSLVVILVKSHKVKVF